jgi:hypothetical protein
MTDPDRQARETDLRLALIRERYGDRLTTEQLDVLRKAVGAIVEAAVALRAITLSNADEPGQRFSAYRADE